MHAYPRHLRSLLVALEPALYTHRVNHLHHADGASSQEAHGHHWLLHQDQRIYGVTVLAQRLGHKAVVVGIHHGAVQHAVHKQETSVLVQLILHCRSVVRQEGMGA